MQRRQFLSGSLALAAAGLGCVAARKPGLRLMSVSGWVDNPGVILPHEHILVDFIGAAEAAPSRYDANEVFKTALPKLKELKALGCDTLMECTPAYLARDVRLLARLSRASGLNILTNTGYYGAREHLFLPEHVSRESPAQLAARWIGEWKQGIEGTGIRPGFIKTGVDKAPLSELQVKIVRAAAITHRQTGMAIGIHTGDGAAAREELGILEKEGVSPEAFIWIHAQSESDSGHHIRLAEKGVWIEFDGIAPESLEQHLRLLQTMKAARLLNRTLISQDAGWYHAGEAGGGNYRGYGLLFTGFLPLLRENGFSAAEITMLTRHNPLKAFGINR
ncbi:MAG TPA: hypothetical protein VD772_03360 [Anseongella sp.]|nr:hypothetical protein [Anseongella sp.]